MGSPHIDPRPLHYQFTSQVPLPMKYKGLQFPSEGCVCLLACFKNSSFFVEQYALQLPFAQLNMNKQANAHMQCTGPLHQHLSQHRLEQHRLLERHTPQASQPTHTLSLTHKHTLMHTHAQDFLPSTFLSTNCSWTGWRSSPLRLHNPQGSLQQTPPDLPHWHAACSLWMGVRQRICEHTHGR